MTELQGPDTATEHPDKAKDQPSGQAGLGVGGAWWSVSGWAAGTMALGHTGIWDPGSWGPGRLTRPLEASVSSPINGAEIRAPTPETAGGARSMLGAEAQPTPGQR